MERDANILYCLAEFAWPPCLVCPKSKAAVNALLELLKLSLNCRRSFRLLPAQVGGDTPFDGVDEAIVAVSWDTCKPAQFSSLGVTQGSRT